MNIQFSGIAIGGIALMLLLGVLGFIPNILSGGTAPLSVVAPNGGEVWQKSSTQIIQWNISKPGSVTISLQKAGVTILQIAKSPSGSTSYRWIIPTTLADGANYKILITAGKLSDTSDANFSIVTPDTMAPSTPTGLSVTMISSSQINFVWNPSTDNVGVVGYRVYRNNSQIATTNTPSYADNGLAANTAYVYAVAATDAAGNVSALSSSISATTQPSPSTKFSLNERVQTTANVNVRSTASTTATLLGTQPIGTAGVIVGGPIWSTNYWWWEVNFDIDPDGWVVEDYLAKEVVSPPPAPPPTTPSPPTTIIAKPIVTVLAPNGGETWKKGTTQTIQWKLDYSDTITIHKTELWLAAKDPSTNISVNVYKITDTAITVVGSNSYQWTLPADVVDASNYTMLAVVTYSAGTSYNVQTYDYGDAPFTVYTTDISSVPPPPSPPPYFSSPSVTMISPSAGEAWQRGKTHSIRWKVSATNQPTGPVATVIYLDIVDTCASKLRYYTIVTNATSVVGDNSYQWAIPSDFNESQIYRVTLQIQTGASYGFATTQYFTGSLFTIYATDPALAPKSFYFKDAKTTVLYPNGGEVWQPGNTYPIKWNFTKVLDQFVEPFSTSIQLSYATDNVRRGAYSIAQNQPLTKVGDNEFVWTFPIGATDVSGIPLQGSNLRMVVQVNQLSYYPSLGGCRYPWDESDQNITLSP